jgi:uroporphyrinogen-III decarboxylase
LYADCEGFDGGSTQIPEAERGGLNIGNGKLETSVELKFSKAEQVSRQWIAGNLYPTILYRYSDAVVYVTRNFRYA